MKLSGERHPEVLVVMFLRGTTVAQRGTARAGGTRPEEGAGEDCEETGTSSTEKKTQMHGDRGGLSVERRENWGKRREEIVQEASMGGQELQKCPSDLSIKLYIQTWVIPTFAGSA